MIAAKTGIRLTRLELTVEAGATAETSIEIGPSLGPLSGAVEGYDLQVQGLPASWYTLGRTRVRVSAGESAGVLLVIHPPQNTHDLGERQFLVEIAAQPDGEVTRFAVRAVVLPPGALERQSRLFEYLPAMYRGDPFLSRFLLIFQSIIDPLEAAVDSTHHYLDPGLTPPRFLRWLASWVGVTFDPDLDEPGQRELIRQAVELSRWKGTRRGLQNELKIRTGRRALFVENFDGLRLGHDAALGLNTQLGERRDGCVVVTFPREVGATIDHESVDALVAELKPAHAGHIVRIVAGPSGP